MPAREAHGAVRFTLAVQTKKDETTWVDCVCFGKPAELAQQYITEKGQTIFVSGKPEARAWLSKDGDGAKGQLNVVVSQIKVISWPARSDKAEESETQAQPGFPKSPQSYAFESSAPF